MKLAKLLLTIGLLTNIAAFGVESSQPKIEFNAEMIEELVANFGEVIMAQNPNVENLLQVLSNGPLVATPTQLKKTYSDENFTEFSLKFCTLSPSTFYIWALASQEAEILHFLPFKTDEKGAISAHAGKMGELKTVLLEQVGKGEAIGSVLFDVVNGYVTLDTLTPFPFTYPVGEKGILSLSTKLPYPIIHVECEGLLPEEQITLTFKEDEQQLTADKNGKISTDLFIDEVIAEEPIEFTLTTSAGAKPLTFGEAEDESTPKTTYKAKINL